MLINLTVRANIKPAWVCRWMFSEEKVNKILL